MYIFLQNLPTMNILDPIFFIARCSTIFASELPEYCSHIELFLTLWFVRVVDLLLICSQTSGDLLTTIGALYGATLFLCFNNAGTVQAMVSIERTVHYREKAAGMYSAIPYALAQVCCNDHTWCLTITSIISFCIEESGWLSYSLFIITTNLRKSTELGQG
jgi:hypothetical protein